MKLFRAAVIAALSLFGALPATAQDVTLKSQTGAVEITGTLLGYDGEFYRVDTIYGQLTVDGSGVTCEGPGCPNLIDYIAELTISGSATMGEFLMPALVEAFALRNGYRVERLIRNAVRFEYHLYSPETKKKLAVFSFRTSNSDEGFADLLADEADIAMSLREIRPAESKLGYEAGLGDMSDTNRSRVLALDGMVAVVAPGNPVSTVSPLQLAQMIAGRIDNWRTLGGPDAPVAVHLLAPSSGLAQAVEDQLMAPAGLEIAATVERHGRGSVLVDAVTRDPFAIGVASFAETGNTKRLVLTGTCGFALAANRATIKTEDYPLTAPMFLYFPARRLPQIARSFLAYTRSPSAQVVIRRAGFVDQAPEEVALGAQGDRLANAMASAGPEVDLDELQRMVTTLRPMKRLSISFRFQRGSSRLDAQSRSNIQQLARAIEGGLYDGRRLSFVGFSDGEGAAATNKAIAEKRAQAVRDAVMTAAETANPDRLTIDTQAFGEAMPMACDDSAWGRQVNRRVEVWAE